MGRIFLILVVYGGLMVVDLYPNFILDFLDLRMDVQGVGTSNVGNLDMHLLCFKPSAIVINKVVGTFA